MVEAANEAWLEIRASPNQGKWCGLIWAARAGRHPSL
jgi:hypothetical protein